MNESNVQAKRVRVSSFAGTGCLVQGLGLLAPFVLYAAFGGMGGIFGGVLLLILFGVGSSMSLSWRCGSCGNPIASKHVRLCPVCHAELE
jgi:hypothetical protein